MSFQYIEPTEDQIETMQKFRDRFQSLSDDISTEIKSSRGKSLALTKLEEASFWLNKGITHNDD